MLTYMCMHRRLRRTSASTFVLVIVTICCVIVPILVVAGQLGLYSVDRGRLQNLVEAAGLLAAKDLSRLVMNDSHFGYVSLSNYAPIGKGICAPDGEPLPVIGINTLVGTIRQNTIAAQELGNETMQGLVDDDRSYLRSTVDHLNLMLRRAVGKTVTTSGVTVSDMSDIHGDKVTLVSDVNEFLKRSLPANVHLESLSITNGWLGQGGTTTIKIPEPLRLAQVKATDSQQGLYKPFVDIPADGKSFTFAGLGSSSTLVPPAQFRPDDNKHICSILRIECTMTQTNESWLPFGNKDFAKTTYVACCQPFSQGDPGPGSAMTLRFSSGPVAALLSWGDLLKERNFHDTQVISYDVIGGDYPRDRGARMRRLQPDRPPTTAQQFAEHLYYWLRSGHLRPRLDAVLDLPAQTFRCGPGQVYAYEFSKDGTISRRILGRDPFPVGVTGDAQALTVADTGVDGGLSPVIIFRDNVARLGTEYGGKHAGQPLAGFPLNWCELPEYGGDDQLAGGLSKGRLGTGLSIVDGSGLTLPTLAINDATYRLFKTFDGKDLLLQPRSSFYSGGLAVDIEIGGTGQSTASVDVARMRALKR